MVGQHALSLSRLLVLLCLPFLTACIPTLSTSSSADSGGGTGTLPPPGAGGTSFSLLDLDGSWTGILTPTGDEHDPRNFYMRLEDGEFLAGAEGGGGEWSMFDTQQSVLMTTTGVFDVIVDRRFSPDRLELHGTMNMAMDTLTGDFVLVRDDGETFGGTFSLHRSVGRGTFSLDLLAGVWQGAGTNDDNRFRIVDFECDGSGSLVGAQMLRPFDNSVQHTYAAESASFQLSDTSVGRIREVTIQAEDGSELWLSYLLIDLHGTMLSGPGEDSVLGEGYLQLTR